MVSVSTFAVAPAAAAAKEAALMNNEQIKKITIHHVCRLCVVRLDGHRQITFSVHRRIRVWLTFFSMPLPLVPIGFKDCA